jgi:hypothetical protein
MQMKWFDKWFVKKCKQAWDNKDQYVEEKYSNKVMAHMGTIGVAQVERGRPEGERRISFELSTAVGGKILNVRQYDDRKDQHNQQTYVIPNGEDIGERVAKIINLEMFKQ